ncbi:SAM-dependent methyltransferase [Nocardia noduli]|uniref:SAM-dependent methyltransferase n=1 Tax=Nocardia noduli TaxID=2815722 RepID=UPI0027E133A4|nr:SAM-dependent methyltransferase [Nocardia noduli]
MDAVDQAEVLLGQLRGRARGLPQLHTHVADATTWPDRDYDVVQAVLGIFFFLQMASGTEHVIARARAGGRCGLTIWRRGAMETAGQHLRGAVAQVTGTAAESRKQHLIDRINQPETYRGWLTDRGLTQVEVTEHELVLPITPELAWLVVTGSGFAAALAGLDTSGVEAVRRAYLASLNEAGVRHLDATTLVGVGTRPMT